MKKLMTVALLMAFATTASAAGEYGKANRELSMCKVIGQGAVLSYKRKVAGRPPMPLSDIKYLAEIDNTAMEYGYTKAVDEQDAYMHGFSYCMDKIERAYLDKCGVFSCANLKEEAKN